VDKYSVMTWQSALAAGCIMGNCLLLSKVMCVNVQVRSDGSFTA